MMMILKEDLFSSFVLITVCMHPPRLAFITLREIQVAHTFTSVRVHCFGHSNVATCAHWQLILRYSYFFHAHHGPQARAISVKIQDAQSGVFVRSFGWNQFKATAKLLFALFKREGQMYLSYLQHLFFLAEQWSFGCAEGVLIVIFSCAGSSFVNLSLFFHRLFLRKTQNKTVLWFCSRIKPRDPSLEYLECQIQNSFASLSLVKT